MPKAERGSLKDIGKRIKMKGLQKLKFYCQICEKQCRDANGFKCHISSDNHLQQMKIFSSNATKIMDQYSKTFEKNFVATLRMRHSTSKVAANTVYQEMIQDKQHIHMNSTIWTTLSDFVKYLGKTGQCVVEETDRGWYITYIERDMTKLLQAEQTQRRIDAELAAEMEYQQRIEQQIRMAATTAGTTTATTNTTTITAPTKLQRHMSDPLLEHEHDDATPSISTVQLSIRTNHKKKKAVVTTSLKSVFDDDEDDEDDGINNTKDDDPVGPEESPPVTEPSSTLPHHQRPSKTDTITQALHTHMSSTTNNTTVTTISVARGNSSPPQHTVASTGPKTTLDNSQTSTTNDDDPPWIRPNIMVRVINQTLANGKYYRQKGHVIQIDPEDPYVAQVQLHMEHDDDGTNDDATFRHQTHRRRTVVLQLDQEDCETIGPKRVEESICMVRGPYTGWYGTILTFDKKKYRATMELWPPDQPETKTTMMRPDKCKKIIVEHVDYDDFSKLYEP